ncbi:DUF6082 family protein [Streptomyces rubiginosohelvolus]|uniref:DUF6082 family protein n=1 Tax=Streptomyces rubiginosohelvolus TaxID=67362 RepID=UPI0035DF4ABE
MKTSTAVALAASVSAVGFALLGQQTKAFKQRDKHHRQHLDVALSCIQIDWLSAVSTDDDLARIWAPEGVDPETYKSLMSANRMACQLSLRDRLGFVSERQLRFYADSLARTKAFRDYMERFGSTRAEEAVGDERASHFTSVLIDAAGRGDRSGAAR